MGSLSFSASAGQYLAERKAKKSTKKSKNPRFKIRTWGTRLFYGKQAEDIRQSLVTGFVGSRRKKTPNCKTHPKNRGWGTLRVILLGRVAHRIFYLEAQSEYTIRLLVMAGGGCGRVPHPSVLRVRILTWRSAWKKRNAIRCGDFMDRATCISSPSVAIGGGRISGPSWRAAASCI